MALLIGDKSYAGTVEAGFMITQATFSLDTISKGMCYVKDGIKKQHNIPKLDITNVLQPRQATPASQGTYNVSGVVIAPQDCMAYIEFDPRDFEDHFYAEQLSTTLLARELPATAENFMMQLGLNRAFEQLEIGMHMGSVSYTTNDPTDPNYQIKYFDGFIKKALVDGNFISTTSPVTLTAGNILGFMDNAISKLPKAILADPNRYKKVKFCLSIVDYQLYEAAAVLLSFKGIDIFNAVIAKYRGYQVVPLAGLPASTFYLTRAYPDLESNLWVGTNSTEDLMFEFKKLQNNSELFYFKGLFKFDTQIAKMNELVMHTTQVLGNFSV